MDPNQLKELYRQFSAEWALYQWALLSPINQPLDRQGCVEAIRLAWRLSENQEEQLPSVSCLNTYVTHVVYNDIVLYNASKTYFMVEVTDPLLLEAHGGFTLQSLRLVFSEVYSRHCDATGIDQHNPDVPKLQPPPSVASAVHQHSRPSTITASLQEYLNHHLNTLVVIGDLIKQL